MRFVRPLSLIGFFAAVLAGVSPVFAQPPVPTRVVIQAVRGSVHFGDTIELVLKVSYDGTECSAAGQQAFAGTFTLRQNGSILETAVPLYRSFYRECENGTYTAGVDRAVAALDFGELAFTAEYSGDAMLGASTSAAAIVRVSPDLVTSSATGLGTLDVGVVGNGGWYCDLASAEAQPAASAPSAPPGVSFPYGLVRYVSACSYECWTLCPPDTPTIPEQRVLLGVQETLPSSSTFWAYAPSAGEASSSWHPVDSTLFGERGSFVVGGTGGVRRLEGWFGLAITQGLPAVQDLWWTGSQENGWGLAISQNGERMMVVLYVYADDGNPVWLVLSGGSWDATHTRFSGSLYRPSGSDFAHYDASRFQVGAPVGTAALTFAGDSAATLDYEINGVHGTKSVQRQIFARDGVPTQGPYAGLWWGGKSKNGWGMTIAHQGDTLFAVWYTYDASGKPTWYVMPGGSWTSGTSYSGTLYRTKSSPWLGRSYDPAQFHPTPVGTLTLSFAAGDMASVSYTVDGVSGVQGLYKQPF